MARPKSPAKGLDSLSPMGNDLPPASAASKPAPEKTKTKIGFYTTEADRFRAAYMSTRGTEPSATFSDFLSNAVAKEVERLEKKYNHGRQWENEVARGEIKAQAQMRGLGPNK